MGRKSKWMSLIEENKDEIQKYHVETIAIFGSQMRGNATTTSDIDILVSFNDGKKTFRNFMGLKLQLEEIFQIPVDLVTMESIKEEMKPFIMEDITYVEGL